MSESQTIPDDQTVPGDWSIPSDPAAAAREIEAAVLDQVGLGLNRKGVVVGISGGVDSAVCAALAVRALEPRRVLGLLLPERDGSAAGTRRAESLCRQLGIAHVREDITDALAALGCYVRRDAAIRRLFPRYTAAWRQKISINTDGSLPHFELTVADPGGRMETARIPHDIYLEIVAATNMKQRTRKLIEYYHAERLNFAVLGTPNRLEYELGFFVRGGDGLADLKPIAHLYKTEVYALAAYLGVPEEICRQCPSTDTYSLPQSQEEFYFGQPPALMDRLLHAWHCHASPAAVGAALGLSEMQVVSAFRDIAAKRRVASRGLRQAALVRPIEPFEVGGCGRPPGAPWPSAGSNRPMPRR